MSDSEKRTWNPLIKEEVVVAMLASTGLKGSEINRCLEDMGPMKLINPAHEQDGMGCYETMVSEFFQMSCAEVQEWVKEIKERSGWDIGR